MTDTEPDDEPDVTLTIDLETADILREQVETRRGPDDKTVVVFDYCYDLKVKKKKRELYSYSAVYIASQDKWFISGINTGVVPRDIGHLEFMTLLSKPNVITAQVAVAFETFKP